MRKKQSSISLQDLCQIIVIHINSEFASEFRTNQFELIEGRHFTPEDKHCVLISDELAKKNHLSIGDTFTIIPDDRTWVGDFPQWTGYTCDLQIVGIFHINAMQISTKWIMETDVSGNQIFLDANTAYEYHEYGMKNGIVDEFNFDNATFFVDDPAELDTVMERALAPDDVEWNCLDVSYNDTTYQSAIKPLQIMQKIVGWSIAILVCVMIVLLYLVLQTSIQGREKELKIYHVLGIKKRTVLVSWCWSVCCWLCLHLYRPWQSRQPGTTGNSHRDIGC